MATIKQLKAIKNVVENHGNVSRAMIDAGYDATTAKNPKNLTESASWKALMNKHLPDEKIIRKVEEGMEATKVHTSHTEPDRVIPDYPTQHRFTETALKMKGKLNVDEEQLPGETKVLVFNIYGGTGTNNGSNKSATKATNGATDSL